MKLEARTQQDILVVELAGRLDSYATAVCDEIVRIGRAAEPPLVVLDLRRLDYINSSGLTAILVSARDLKARAGELVLAGPHGTAAMALEMAGFEAMMRILPDADAALAVLRDGSGPVAATSRK